MRDQLPVSRDEQIKVKLEYAEPRLTEQTHLNQIEWQLTVAAGAKPVLSYEYSVEYLRSMDVVGLP